MNTYKIKLFIIITTVIALASCEKVIDIDLNSASPQIVIEGNVYDQPGPYIVKLSKTVNFNESNVFPAVRGAWVIIGDNEGNLDTLLEKSPGEYYTSTLQGVVGRTYNLTVTAAGKTYSAVSTIPKSVSIDSLYFGVSEDKQVTSVSINYSDPVNVGNYYHIVEFINGERLNGFDVVDDALNPGGINIYEIFNEKNDSLKTGDNVSVWLESIDRNVFDYLRISNSGEGDAAPANPPSNISNGALGYFNASSLSKKAIVYP